MGNQKIHELRKRMNVTFGLARYITDAGLIENALRIALERAGEERSQGSSEYLIMKAHTFVDREIESVEVGVTPEYYGPLYGILKDRISEVEAVAI